MPPRRSGASAASVARITLADLVHAGMLQPGEQFVYEGHYATVMPNGDLHTLAGGGAAGGSSDSAVPEYLNPTYSSLSSWCSDVKRRGKDSASSVTVSGWVKARLAANPKITVDAIRKQYLKSIGLLDERGKPVPNPPPIPQHAGHAASHALSGTGTFHPLPRGASAAAAAADDDSQDSDEEGDGNDDTYGTTNYYEQAGSYGNDHQGDDDDDDDMEDDMDTGHHASTTQGGGTSTSSRASAVPFGRARHANYNEADSDEDDPEFDAAKYERQKRMPKRKRGLAAARARQAAAAAANQTGNASASAAAAAAVRRASAGGTVKRIPNPAKAAVSKISVTAAKHIGAVLKQQQQQRAAAGEGSVPSSEPDLLSPAMKRARPSAGGAAYDLPTAMAGASASSLSLASNPLAPEPILATPSTAASAATGQASTATGQDADQQQQLQQQQQQQQAGAAQDAIPTPAVVVFPLATDTKRPDALTFRASTACMDCSAVIRAEDDHLTCASCAEAHHPYCTPLYICPPPAAHARDQPWICIFCTFCAKCERNSPRDQLARCSDCTKVYHLDCGQVSAEMIATDGTIVCFECAKCWSCGLTPKSQLGTKVHQQAQAEGKPLVSPPRWDRHPIRAAYQCQTCTTYYANGHFCTVCHKAYSEDDFETPMLGCDGPCAKWVHKACDPTLSHTAYDDIAEDGSDYLCPVCREPEGTDVMTIPAVINAPGYGDKERKKPSKPAAAPTDKPDGDEAMVNDDNHETQPTQPLEHPFADVHGQPVQLPASDDHAPDADGMQVDGLASPHAAPAYTCMPPMHPSAPLATPTEAALAAFIAHRTCAFCGQPESPDTHGLEDGIGRLVFLGGPDPLGLGTGQWAHTGCFYWSVPSTSTSMMAANAAVDEARVLDALEAVRDVPCTLCHLGGANVACGHPAGCPTAYHWSCLVRAMYGGNKAFPQVKPLSGMAGGPNEVKKAKRAHIDVYTHDVRCHLHLATALTVVAAVAQQRGTSKSKKGHADNQHLPGIIQPTMDECIRVCRMRMAIAHDPTVPLYVSAVPAPTPGKLLTTAPPYEPACLVVGGAAVTHIGRLPFEDPTVLLERAMSSTAAAAGDRNGDAGTGPRGPPVIIPVGYTVVRRFWSYKHRGTVTYVVMSREVADESEADVEAAQVAAQAAADHADDTHDAEADTDNPDAVGQVVQGEPTHDHVIVDRYTIPRAQGHRLQWRVQVADDPEGEFTVRATADILPRLLARFPTNAPFLIGRTHHYLVRPESLVLLHHPTIVRFIENLPHAAQISPKEYTFQYVDQASLANMREAECAVRRGSSRTDPGVDQHSFRSNRYKQARQALAQAMGAQDAEQLLKQLRRPAVSAGTAPAVAHASGVGPPQDNKPLPGQTLGSTWDSSVPLPIQYQRLKESERSNVLVRPSKIQGVGLFAARAFNANEMVIEYVGEIIGQKVADMRELMNDRMSVGTYFFALAHDRILDATRMGNASRFINHSCEPNSYARIISPQGDGPGGKRVVIFAARRIEAGEELTYDYKFQLEEDPAKRIPCFCGSAGCRKFMN